MKCSTHSPGLGVLQILVPNIGTLYHPHQMNTDINGDSNPGPQATSTIAFTLQIESGPKSVLHMKPDFGVVSTFCPICSAPHIVLTYWALTPTVGILVLNNSRWWFGITWIEGAPEGFYYEKAPVYHFSAF